jgi:hypothetical protein
VGNKTKEARIVNILDFFGSDEAGSKTAFTSHNRRREYPHEKQGELSRKRP